MVVNLRFMKTVGLNYLNEDKIIEVINKGIGQVLETCWKDLTPITIQFHSREQNLNLLLLLNHRFSYCLLICNATTKNRFIVF